MVLLKNDGPVLPLDPTKSTAIIGPLGDDKHDMLGPWWGRGDDKADGAALNQEPLSLQRSTTRSLVGFEQHSSRMPGIDLALADAACVLHVDGAGDELRLAGAAQALGA